MPRHVAAIDAGTTGTRALVVDADGRVLADAYATHEQSYPREGWVEHDPAELLANARRTLREALAEAGDDGSDLAAVGVTTQRETTVLWDAATGEAVAPAVVWQDRRTTPRMDALDAETARYVRERTGLEPDAYFSASKLEWLLDRDDRRDRAERGELRFGTVDAWLIAGLTGAHVTDVTNASRTMLFDVHDLAWDDRLLAEFGVPRAVLPEVRPSSDPTPYGHTDLDGHLDEAVPVTAALGDQQAALFGQTCFGAGEAKNTYGTGSFLLANTGTEAVTSDHGLVTTVAFQRAGEAPTYALEGSIFSTGAAIEWLVDVGLVPDAAASERVAGEVDSTDGVYVVPAFTGLGAPHWDGRARGLVVGLTRGTERGHLVRATVESTAFQTRDVVAAMEADAGLSIDALRVDGGAVANDLLCQVQADLVGTEVVRPAVRESTGLGAAFAAGLAVDYWSGLDDIRATRRVDRRFRPDVASGERRRRVARWHEAVERSKGWASED